MPDAGDGRIATHNRLFYALQKEGMHDTGTIYDQRVRSAETHLEGERAVQDSARSLPRQ